MAEEGARVLLWNGLSMPIIGFGTYQPKEQLKISLNAALEAGYRHFDSAYVYKTETTTGEVLKKWLDSGKLKREDLFITTKLPHDGIRAECVEKYLKRSLEALQLDYVDLYLIHFPCGLKEGVQIREDEDYSAIMDTTTDIIGVWKEMEAQVDAGRTKSIGLSNFNSKQIKRIIRAARIPPANLQIELNVYVQQKELVAFCNALDISVTAFSILGSKSKDFGIPLSDPVIQKIANKHKKSPGQILLKHAIQRGIAVLPTSTTPDRIRENFQVFDFKLDDEDMYDIYLLDKGYRARLYFKNLLKGIEKHPEYPFNEQY